MIPSAEGKRFRRSGGLPPQAMSALSALSEAGGRPFRRYSGAPLEARQALPGRGMFAMAWRVHCRRLAAETPCPRRGDCRCPPTGNAVSTAGAKGGKGTVWFPCPLLTPPNPPLRRDSLRSRGETGGYEGSVPCVFQFICGCNALNLLCVIRSAVSARPDGAGRQRSAAKSSASIKGCTLEHQTPLWAPRI